MLSFRLPVPGVKRGGCERVAHDLAQGLALRGHQVTVWSADPLPANAAYAVRRIPGSWLIHHGLGFRLVSGYLGNVLALLPDYADADALIAHGDSLFLPLRGIPFLRIMHGSALDEARTARTLPRKLLQFGVYLQELIAARTQTTIAISRNTQCRYPAIRTVIANGVDTTRFVPGAVKSTDPSILFVGMLGGRKRGLLLQQWFNDTILPAMPQAVLWMVTEQEGPPAPGVRYFTGVSQTVLSELYQAAWVFASPSTYEGFGLPYLEAMASGTPVIATANPGSLEVLDRGCYGELIHHDPDFALALLSLLQNSSKREHLTAQGLDRARELSLERTIDHYEALLQSLISAQRAQVAQPAQRAAL